MKIFVRKLKTESFRWATFTEYFWKFFNGRKKIREHTKSQQKIVKAMVRQVFSWTFKASISSSFWSSFERKEKKVFLFRMPAGIPPMFLGKPTIQQEAKTVTLQVEIVADPNPLIHWTRDSKELLNVDKFQSRVQHKDSNKHLISLEIKVKSNRNRTRSNFVFLSESLGFGQRHVQMHGFERIGNGCRKFCHQSQRFVEFQRFSEDFVKREKNFERFLFQVKKRI